MTAPTAPAVLPEVEMRADIEIRSAALTLRMRPSRGAKIVSLRDAAGREYLTRSSRAAPPPGTAFGRAEMAGWDECAPTIAACEVAGASLPDHGDAWDAAWAASGDGWSHSGMVAGPYRLERRIVATGDGGIRLEYAASAATAETPFLWAAHPQFAAPAGTRVEFAVPPRRLVETDGSPVPWSAREGCIDDLAAGTSRKRFIAPDETVDSADLVRPDGGRLRLSWSAPCRYLGLWLDASDWASEPVIAIEPSLAFGDELAAAVREDRCAWIGPDPLRWWVEVRLMPGSDDPPARGTASVSSR